MTWYMHCDHLCTIVDLNLFVKYLIVTNVWCVLSDSCAMFIALTYIVSYSQED